MIKQCNHLKASQLEKWFGHQRVFSNLDLTLDPGIHLVKGKNGCGKSTLLSILAGSDNRFKGTVELNGLSLSQQHYRFVQQVSYAPDKLVFFPDVSVYDFFRFVKHHRDFRADKSFDETCEAFQFEKASTKRLADLSLGNAKKLLLITALLIESRLLLFDEPLNGLDPHSTDIFLKLIRELPDKIILIASHRSDDYSNLAHRTYRFDELIKPE